MARPSNLLPSLYRRLMALTKKRGMLTLGRINARLFAQGQLFHIRDTSTPFLMPGDPHFFGYLIGHEHHITRLVQRVVRPGDLCFDVGANIGYFANQMSHRAGRDGEVHAYEIDPANFAHLEANAAIVRQAGGNIVLNRKAVSDKPGLLAIAHGEESTLHKVRDATDGDPASLTVPAVTLADEVAALAPARRIRLVKIDIEGHESAAIATLDPVIANPGIDFLVMEIFRDEVDQVEDVLRRWGDKVERVTVWNGSIWADMPLSAIPWRTDILVEFTGREG